MSQDDWKEKTRDWIKRDEGIKTKIYKDSEGFLSIGWGRNLESKGIRISEAILMFENDFSDCLRDLSQFSWFNDQHLQICVSILEL